MRRISFWVDTQFRLPYASAYKTALLMVGDPDPIAPYGAKESGEGFISATVPAVCNAIYDAAGVRITEFPVTPEESLAGVEPHWQYLQESG